MEKNKLITFSVQKVWVFGKSFWYIFSCRLQKGQIRDLIGHLRNNFGNYMNLTLIRNENYFLMIFLHLCNDAVRFKTYWNFHIYILLLGSPVNRIPIMAKQVLDLYLLYKLVVDKGGLVEVINRKIWRDITKGLR